MRLYLTILFLTVLAATYGEPDPKKFNKDIKEKDKKPNATLTDEERKFLREVEAKFGLKTELENKKNDVTVNIKQGSTTPYPAVIAIEIVNDTDSSSKNKRTIDANLGYGYKTNNGYSYSYFGKPAQEKGKFMIYPYSQEDIPATSNYASSSENIGRKHTAGSTNVEIQPSNAFELVTVNDDSESYHHKNIRYNDHIGKIQGTVSSPPLYSQMTNINSHQMLHPSTLYTTYNGEGFSGLSGQFPKVMPNYFVNPSQLLNRPEYQSAGLTTDHLHTLQDTNVEQRVIPVLVLRIPTSYLKNPTAELFANLPENYPLSRYLNNVNLQELVNEYFQKIGYSIPPQLMAYQDSLSLNNQEAKSPVLPLNHEPQSYAVPYVQPSYTHADYSGVQYSAVKPVMARYPSSYTPQRYYPAQGHMHYRQPMHQQKYEYTYQYVPKTPVTSQSYYIHPQYQQQSHETSSQDVGINQSVANQETDLEDTHVDVRYEIPSQTNYENTATRTVEYRHPQVHVESNYETNTATPEYELTKESTGTVSEEHGRTVAPVYGVPREEPASQEHYTSQQEAEKETLAIYPSQQEQSVQKYYSQLDSSDAQAYTYQEKSKEHATSVESSTHNYVSTDHTVATVLPLSYKGQSAGPAVQTVSYVTPMPYSYKYQSPYKVMVPQTFLINPVSEKVSYVNSQPMSSTSLRGGYRQEYNPEEEYTVASHYVPPVGKQKPPQYPRNHHSYPKRMVRPENNKTKKQNEKTEKKRSS